MGATETDQKTSKSEAPQQGEVAEANGAEASASEVLQKK